MDGQPHGRRQVHVRVGKRYRLLIDCTAKLEAVTRLLEKLTIDLEKCDLTPARQFSQQSHERRS